MNLALQTPMTYEESKTLVMEIGLLGGDLSRVKKEYELYGYEGILNYKKVLMICLN